MREIINYLAIMSHLLYSVFIQQMRHRGDSMTIDLKTLDIMTFPEASLRWNKERSYVYHQYSKYRWKFLEGSFAAIGNGKKPTYIITREGMEHLMKTTEVEVNKRVWLVRRHIDRNYINYEEKVDTESEARQLIVDLILSEVGDTDKVIEFEKFQNDPVKTRVIYKENAYFTYEELNQ